MRTSGESTALDLEREFFQNRDQCLAYIVNLMEFWDEEDISSRREEVALARGRADAARNLLRMGLALSKTFSSRNKDARSTLVCSP